MADNSSWSHLTWTRAAPEDVEGPGPWIEIAFGPGGSVHLRDSGDRGTVVTTTAEKWEAFAKGVVAGEFDHFTRSGTESP
ncbi:DUF397 domain-containing protein [Streptomyces sp. NPDC051840]|uniref:DUF397 domain-containing protein n=1 Tax=unclassified Streptomyces TaxID=2593676 RepID=UPI003427436C